jgi:[ribosomal protein S18]-alanine N-acetyltransferase
MIPPPSPRSTCIIMSLSLADILSMSAVEKDGFLIRPMAPEDLEQVREIDRISFSLPWPESAFQYELNANPAALLWVAEAEVSEKARRVLGMIVAWLIEDEIHIATIAVHPDYRGQGIARRLLTTVLKEGIYKGASQAMLEVRAGNQAAQALYRQFGFEVVSRRPKYYRDNQEDALLMNLSGMDEKFLQWLEGGRTRQWRYVNDS